MSQNAAYTHRIEVKLPQGTYPILIGTNSLTQLSSLLTDILHHPRIAVLADQTAFVHYEETIRSAFSKKDFSLHVHTFDAIEEKKNNSTISQLYDALFSFGFDRGDCVLAFGGGVAGDLVGFTAATFLRGIDFVQVPSTLLAMVDASVGGKVGYNSRQGKNLIGAFHQPRAVLIDPSVLGTLPKKEFRSGLAECIKHAVLEDSDLFTWTQSHLEDILALRPSVLEELIARNVACKAAVVAADEKEKGIRAHLNFGHTFAHAIESASGYGTWLHGEAVSLGMIAATHTAVAAGICTPEVEASLHNCLTKAGLPVSAVLPPVAELREAMQSDKKVSAGKLRLVLPRRLGEVGIFDAIADEHILRGWERIRH